MISCLHTISTIGAASKYDKNRNSVYTFILMFSLSCLNVFFLISHKPVFTGLTEHSKPEDMAKDILSSLLSLYAKPTHDSHITGVCLPPH